MIHRDMKTPNVLIDAAVSAVQNSGSIDMIPLTKVADFGTVREDVRHRKRTIQSGTTTMKVNLAAGTTTATNTHNQQTHATTGNIIGTLAYMPSEYLNFGFVSEKTDSFAFGIIICELMTSLDGRGSRALLDLQLATVDYESLVQVPEIEQCGWPEGLLRPLAGILDRCTKAKPANRSSVAEVVPLLEAMVASR
jgi:serine/threonine protein kinase